MTFKPEFPKFLIVCLVATVALSGCGLRVESPTYKSSPTMGEEQGQYFTHKDDMRPVEGFDAQPMVNFAPPPVDDPVDLNPKPRPDASGLGVLSGYSLRLINDALNKDGEGERISWYEDRQQYQLRVDSYTYIHNARYCKDALILKRHNDIHAEWRRHYVTFCRVKPDSPWKLAR